MFLPPDRVLYEFAALSAKSRLATAVRIGAAGRRLSLESLQRSPLFPLNHQHTPPSLLSFARMDHHAILSPIGQRPLLDGSEYRLPGALILSVDSNHRAHLLSPPSSLLPQVRGLIKHETPSVISLLAGRPNHPKPFLSPLSLFISPHRWVLSLELPVRTSKSRERMSSKLARDSGRYRRRSSWFVRSSFTRRLVHFNQAHLFCFLSYLQFDSTLSPKFSLLVSGSVMRSDRRRSWTRWTSVSFETFRFFSLRREDSTLIQASFLFSSHCQTLHASTFSLPRCLKRSFGL